MHIYIIPPNFIMIGFETMQPYGFLEETAPTGTTTTHE